LVTSFFQIFVTAKFIDSIFKNKANSNFTVTTDGVDTAVASVHTRTIQDVNALASENFLKVQIPDEFRIDASPFVDRPYFIGSFDWANTAPQFSLIGPSNVRQLPGDVLRSNVSLLNAMKIGSYYRSDLSLQISVAGTVSHAGILLVGILPPLSSFPNAANQRYLINTILSGPHAFLSANEATSISLEVPWYCNSDLATLDMEPSSGSYKPSGDISVVNGNYATLVFLVLNPLAPSTSASTSVTVTIDAAFRHLDILVPTPRYVAYTQSGLVDTVVKAASSAIDAGTSFVKSTSGDFIDRMRQSIKDYTGLHNPNNPSIDKRMVITNRNFINTVDEEQFFETLDPNPSILRTVDRPIFGTTVDEMAISHIISKNQYIGQFRVRVADSVGKLLWTRPISPYQGGLEADTALISNNIELLHRLSRAWKGSLRITIQSVMNNKQQVKLRLLQMYNPSLSILAGYPTYTSILNAPSHLIEFTAGNQTQEIVLPYLCRNAMCPNMRDTSSESIFHGQYYVYLASKLANADGSPEEVNFNVYISLEPDFVFYGYATEVNNAATPAKFQSLEVMNEPQEQSNVLSFRRDGGEEEFNRLMPLHDIRPLLRRITPYVSKSELIDPAADHYDVINIGTTLYRQNVGNGQFFEVTPHQLVNSMFYGRTGGIKMSVSFFNSVDQSEFSQPAILDSINLEVSFIPPNFYVDGSSGVFKSSLIATTGLSKYLSGTGSHFPVPYIVSRSGNARVYDFKVPDTNFYKFIGSPTQLASSNTSSNLSTGTLGYISLRFVNLSPVPQKVNYVISFAYTDETRCGFHSIAPLVQPPTDVDDQERYLTPYFGTPSDASLLPSIKRNKYLYYSA
jgi:hypothetical protein